MTSLSLSRITINIGVFLFICSFPVQADIRNALLIGNGDYAISALPNATSEVEAISSVLKDADFRVIESHDENLSDIRTKFREFAKRISASKGPAFFYYVGHSIQFKDINYLLPSAADIRSLAEVPDRAISLNVLLEYMDDAKNSVNIVILNTPYSLPFEEGKLSPKTGLAPIDGPPGSFIVFSTKPGTLASSPKNDKHGFGDILASYLLEKDLSFEQIIKRVRSDLLDHSNQLVWQSSSLRSDFYLDKNRVLDVVVTTDVVSQETQAWLDIHKLEDKFALEAFIKEFPHSNLVGIAKLKIERLEKSENPVVEGPSSPTSKLFLKATRILDSGVISLEQLDEPLVYLNLIKVMANDKHIHYRSLLDEILNEYIRLAAIAAEEGDNHFANEIVQKALALAPDNEALERLEDQYSSALGTTWLNF